MKIYRRVKCRGSESTMSASISNGVATLPTNYIGLKYAYVNTSPVKVLKWATPWQIYEQYPVRSGGNIPELISREGDTFIFGPYPGDYTVRGIVYVQPTLLSGSNETNWYTTHATDLLLYGSLLEAAAFLLDDPRIPIWSAAFEQAINDVRSQDHHEGQESTPPRMRAS